MKPSANRVPILVLVLIPVLAFTAAAAGQPEKAAGAAEGARGILEYTTISARPEVVERPSLYDDYLLAKFGIKAPKSKA